MIGVAKNIIIRVIAENALKSFICRRVVSKSKREWYDVCKLLILNYVVADLGSSAMATFTRLLLAAAIGWSAVSPWNCMCGMRFLSGAESARFTACPYCQSEQPTKPGLPLKQCCGGRTLAAKVERSTPHEEKVAEFASTPNAMEIASWQRRASDAHYLDAAMRPAAFHLIDSSDSLSIAFCRFII